MKLLLFPAVTELATLESLATLLVARNEGATLPVLTQLSVISEQVWLTPVVLEVMRIDTLGFIMIMVERAPLSLEEEYVEVEVLVLGENVMD